MKRFMRKGKILCGMFLLIMGMGMASMTVHAEEADTTGASTDGATGLNDTTEDYSIPSGSAYVEEVGDDITFENTDSSNAIQNALDAAIKYATNVTEGPQTATIVVEDGTYVGGLQLDQSEDSTLGQVIQQMVAQKVTEKLTAEGKSDSATDEEKNKATEEAKTEVTNAVSGITIRIVAKDALGENKEILLTSAGNANMEGAVNIDGLNVILAGIYLSTNGTIGISNTETFEYYGTAKDDVVDISLDNVSDSVVINGGAGNDKLDVTVTQSPNMTLDITADMIGSLTGEAKTAYETLCNAVTQGGSLVSQEDGSTVADNLKTILDALMGTPASWNNDVSTNITVSGGDGNDELAVKLVNSTSFASTYAKDAAGIATGSLLDMKLDFAKIALTVNGDAGNDRMDVSGGMSLDLQAQFLNTLRAHMMEKLNANNLLTDKSSITLNGGSGDDIITADTTGGFSSFREVDWNVNGEEGYDRLHLSGKLEDTDSNLSLSKTGNLTTVTAKTVAQLSFLNGLIALDNKKAMNIEATGMEAYSDTLENKKSVSLSSITGATDSQSYTNYILEAVKQNDEDECSYVDFENSYLSAAENLFFNNIIVKLADGTSKLIITKLKAAGFNIILAAERIQILGEVIGKNILMNGSNESVWSIGLDAVTDDLNGDNDIKFEFTVDDPKTNVNITVEEDAVIKASQTIDMVVVSEQNGFYLKLDFYSLGADALEKLNFFTYKDGNASIDIKGKLLANGPIQAVSKVIVVSDTSNNALKAFIPVGVCIAATDSHINVSGNAEIESVSSILMHASNYISLNSQARAGVAPIALAFVLALPDTFVTINDNAKIKSESENVYLIADAVVRAIAVATGAPVNVLATKNASGGYLAVIVVDQDTQVSVNDAASVLAGENVVLSSTSNVSANSASISVPVDAKAINAKGVIQFVEKIAGVTKSSNQSTTGKLASMITGSNSLGNLFTKGTEGAEASDTTETTKKSSTQAVGAFDVNYISNVNQVLVNTTGIINAARKLIMNAFAMTISYAKADGSLYKNPTILGFSAAENDNNAIGAGIAVVYYEHVNTAAVKNGQITANGLTVSAITGKGISSAIAKAGHIPTATADLGIGGAISVHIASDKTTASLAKEATYTIGNADVIVLATADHTYITVADASGKRAVKAINVPVTGFQIPVTQTMYNKEGTGVGAGIAVYVGGGDVTADIEDGTVLNSVSGVQAKNVSVTVNRTTKETVIAEAGAGGGKAIAPVIATVVSGYSAESNLGSSLSTEQDYYNGNVDVTAQNQVIRKIKSDASAVGVSVGAGGSFVVAVINDSSAASLKRNVNAVNIHVLAKGVNRLTADSTASAAGAAPATVTTSSAESTSGTAATIITKIKDLIATKTSSTSSTPAAGESNEVTKSNEKGEADKIADKNINSAKELSKGVNSKNINSEKIEQLTKNRQQAQTSEGNVQVAAAFVVNVMQHTVLALIGDGLKLTARAVSGADDSGICSLKAVNDTDAVISANGSAIKAQTGIGVAAAVNVVTYENKAVFGDSRLDAKKFEVSADTLEAAEAATLEEILASLVTFLANVQGTELLVSVLEKQLPAGTTLQSLIDAKVAEMNTGDDAVSDANQLAEARQEVRDVLVSEMVARLTGEKATEAASDLVKGVVEGLLQEVMENFLKPENLINLLMTGESTAIQDILAKASYMGEVAFAKIKSAVNTYLRMKFGSNDEMDGVGSKISTTAISGAGAANIGIAGAVAVTVITATTQAVIADRTENALTTDINVSGETSLYARQVEDVYTTATAAADRKGAADKNKNASASESGDSGKSVGVGASASTTIINALTEAGIGKNRTVKTGTMSIIAKAYNDVETISVAGSDPIARRQKEPEYVPTIGATPAPSAAAASSANSTGTKSISVDASAAVGLVNNTINAYVSEGSKVTTTGTDTIAISDTEKVNFYLHSEQHGETLTSASAFAVGSDAAVGACAAVNLPASDVTTLLAGECVTAGTAKIDAYTYDADECHAYATVVGASLDRYLDKLRDMLQMASLNAGTSTNALNAKLVNKLNGVISNAKTTGASTISKFMPASVGALLSQNVSTEAAPDTANATSNVKTTTGTDAKGQETNSEKQSINIAAAVAVNVTKHIASVVLSGCLNAMKVIILAENHGNFRTLGTGATVTGSKDVKANNISLGVAVSTNKNEASVAVNGSVIATGDITVDSILTQNMDGVYKGLLGAQAIAGSISANGGVVGVSGAVAILIGNALTSVNVGDGASIQGKNISMNATDKSKYAVRAGSLTVSKGANAAVGASYAMIYAKNNTIVMVGKKAAEGTTLNGVTIKGDTLSIKAEKCKVDSSDYEFPLSTSTLFTVDVSKASEKGLINLTTTDGSAGKYSVDITLSSDDFLKLIDMLNYLASVNYYAEAIAGSILGGGNADAAVAGSMAMVYLENETKAEIGDKVTIILTGDMKQEALETTNARMITTSLSASKAKVGVGASITCLVDTEKILAVTGDDVVIETNGNVDVHAKNNGNILAITVAAAASTSSGGATLGGAVNVIDSKNQVNAVIGKNNSITKSNHGQTDGAVTVLSENNSDYMLINTSVTGSAGVAVGGTVAVIVMDNETVSSILDGTEINAKGNVTVKATADENLFNILASVSGSTGKPAVAGTIGVIITNSDTEASLGDEVKITSDNAISVLTDSKVKQFMILAALTGSVSSVAVGATVTVDIMNHTVKAFTGKNCILKAGRTVLIQAIGTDDIFLLTAAGALAGGSAAIAGAIPVVVTSSTIQAVIGEANKVTAEDSVGTIAVLNSNFYNIAGSISASGNTGIGATISTLVMENNILAKVMEQTSVTALANVTGTGAGVKIPNREERRKGLVVHANMASNLLVIAVSGAASGSTAVGGVIDTVVINNKTMAIVCNHVAMNAKETRNQATGEITKSEQDDEAGAEAHALVEAEDDTHIYNIAGALAVSGSTGVGATVAVTVFNNVVKAQILDGCHIYANGDVIVNAVEKTVMPIIIVTFGASGSAAVAGAVSVALFENETEASIGKNTKITSADNVKVLADADNQIISIAGAAAVSGSVAVGAVMPFMKFLGCTSAYVNDDAVIDAMGDVVIKASSKEDIYGFAAGAAGSGTASVSGTLELIITEVITKAYTGSRVKIHGENVTIQAVDDFALTGAAGAIAVSGTAGVGLSVLVSLSYNTVAAYTGSANQILADKNIEISAKDNRDVAVYAVTAGIGAAGAGVAGTVVVTIVGSKLSKDSAENIGKSEINPQSNVDYAFSATGNTKAQSYQTDAEAGSYFASENVSDQSSSSGAVDGANLNIATETNDNSENSENKYNIDDSKIEASANESTRPSVNKQDCVSAFAGNASTLTAGYDLSIKAVDLVTMDMITGVLAAGLYAGVGIGVSVGILYSNVLAYTEENVTLSAGNNLMIQAAGGAEEKTNADSYTKKNVADASDSYTVRVITVGGAAGAAGVTVSTASLDVYTVTDAHLSKGSKVLKAASMKVNAESNYGEIIVWNIAASAGVVGANGTVTRGNYDARVSAYIAADCDIANVSGQTEVTVSSDTTLNVLGVAASAGAVGANAIVILAFYSAKMESFIGQGTSMTNCGPLSMLIKADVTAKAAIASLAAGAAAVGVGVVMVKLVPIILNYAGRTPDGYTLNAASVSTNAGTLNNTAITIKNDCNSKATVDSISVNGGAVTGNALAAIAINRTKSFAGIVRTNVSTGSLTITALMDAFSDVDAKAAAISGVAAIGAIVAYSELKTCNAAEMDLTGVTVQAANVTIQAGSLNNISRVDTNVITGALAGMAAITVNVAFARNAYQNIARISGNGGTLNASGDINITTYGKAISNTDIKGIQLSLVSVGASLAMSYLEAVSKAGIEGINSITGKNIKITSNLNNNDEYCTTATVLSAMGGIVCANGAVGVAVSRAENTATASGNITALGDLLITANGNAKAKAVTGDVTAGFISVGLMFTTALAEGTYQAVLVNNSTTKISAKNIQVLCNSNTDAYSMTKAAVGGVNLSFASGKVNFAYSDAASNIYAGISGTGAGLFADNNVTVKAEGTARSVADAKGSDADSTINLALYKLAATSATAKLTTVLSAFVKEQTNMVVKGTLQILAYLNNNAATDQAVSKKTNGAYAIAGSNGANVSAIGVEASAATALQSANVKAYVSGSTINATGKMDIQTLSTVLSYADIDTNNFGIIGGIGAVNTYAYGKGIFDAYMTAEDCDVTVGALSILSKLYANRCIATTSYLTGGVINVSVLNAITENDTQTKAYINGDNATVLINGDADVTAVSEANLAYATVRGITAVSAVKVGNALTEVYLRSIVKAYLTGTNRITGLGSFTVSAKNNGIAKAYSNNSTGITLIGVTGAESFAENKMVTYAVIENQEVSVNGDVTVLAAEDAQIVLSNIKNGAELLGIGAMVIGTNISNEVYAGIGNGTTVSAGGNLKVDANANSNTSLKTEATTGGLVNGSSIIEQAVSRGKVKVYVGDDANLRAGNDLYMTGKNTIYVTVKTEDSKVSGISLGAYVVTTNSISDVTVDIGKRAVLYAGRDLSLSASDYIEIINNTVLFSAGLVGGTASVTRNNATQNVTVNIQDGSAIKSVRNTEIAAKTDHMMQITCKSSSYGAASVSAVIVSNQLTRNCLVIIGDYVVIEAENGDITIVSYSVPSTAINGNTYAMIAEATGGSAGLFEVAGAKAVNELQSNTNITIGKGGRIETTYGDLTIAAETGSSIRSYAYRDAAQAVASNTTEAVLTLNNPVSVVINGTADEKAKIIGRNVKITATNSVQKLCAEAYSYMHAVGAVTKAIVTVKINAAQLVDIHGGDIRGYDSVAITAMASEINHNFVTHSEIFGAVGVVYATTTVTGSMKAKVATDVNTEIASADTDIQAFAPALTEMNHVVKADAVANTIIAWVFKIIGYVVKWVMKAIGWLVGLFSKKAKQRIEEAVYGWVEEIQSSTAYPKKTDTLQVDSELALNGKISVGGAAAGIVVDINEDGSVNAIGVEGSDWLNKVVVDHVNKTVTLPYIYNTAEGVCSLDAGDGLLTGNLKIYLNNYLPYITFRNHSDYTLILSDITVFNTDVNPVDIVVTAKNNTSGLSLEYGDETPIISVIADKASDLILNGELNNVKGQLNIQMNGGNVYVGDGGIQDQDEILRGDTEFLTKMFVGTNIWVNTLVISGANNIGKSAQERLQIGLIRYAGYNNGTKIAEPAKDAEVDVVASGNIYAGFALLEVLTSEETLSSSVLNNLAAVKSLYLKHIKAGGIADIYLPAAKRLYVYKDGTNYEGMEIAYPGDYSDTYLFIPSTALFAGGTSYIVKDTNGTASQYIMTADGLFTLTGELSVDSDVFLSTDISGIKVGDVVTELYVYNLPDNTNVFVTAAGEVILITSGTGTDKLTMNLTDLKFNNNNGIITLTINDSNTGAGSYITIENGIPTMHIGDSGVTLTIKPQSDGSWLLPNGIKVHMMFALINGTNNQLVTTTYLGEYNGNKRYMIGNLTQSNDDGKYYVFDIKTENGKSTFVEAYLYTKTQITQSGREALYRDQTIDEAISTAEVSTKLEAISTLDSTTAQKLAEEISALVTSGIQVKVSLTQQRRLLEEEDPVNAGQYRYTAYYQVILSVVLKDIASNKSSTEYAKTFILGTTPLFADELSELNGTKTEETTGKGTVYEEADDIPGRVLENGSVTEQGVTITENGTLVEDKVSTVTEAKAAADVEVAKLNTSSLTNENIADSLKTVVDNIAAQIGANINITAAMSAPTVKQIAQKDANGNDLKDEGGNTLYTDKSTYTYIITFVVKDANGNKQEIKKEFTLTASSQPLETVDETAETAGNAKKETTLAEAETTMKTELDKVTSLSANTLTAVVDAIKTGVSKEVSVAATYQKTGFNLSTLSYQYRVTVTVTVGGASKSYSKDYSVLAKQMTLASAEATAESVLNDISISDYSPYTGNSTLTADVEKKIADQLYGNVKVTVTLEQKEAIAKYDSAVENSVNAYQYSYVLKVTLSDILNSTLTALSTSKNVSGAKWLLGTKPYVTVTEQTPGWSENKHMSDVTEYSENGSAQGIAYGNGYRLILNGVSYAVLVKEDTEEDSGYILRYGDSEFAIEKLEATELKSDGTATFRLGQGSYSSNAKTVYDLIRKYVWAVKDNKLTMYELSDMQAAKNTIYEVMAGDIRFTNGDNLVVNRVIAEYPGTLTNSEKTEYVYVSMTASSLENADEDRTLENSVIYISKLSNQLSLENPFKDSINNPYGDSILVFEKIATRDIYTEVTEDIDTTGITVLTAGNGKQYYKIGYIAYDAAGKEIYHIFINGVDTVFDPFTAAVEIPEEPQKPDDNSEPEVKNQYTEDMKQYQKDVKAYQEYVKQMDYSRALFGKDNIAVSVFDKNSSIVFDITKGEGIVLNPNGTVYYQPGNEDFVIPFVTGTSYFLMTENERIQITEDGVIYEYLKKKQTTEEGVTTPTYEVYASNNLTTGEMRWNTESGYLKFNTRKFSDNPVILSAGYKLQGSKVSDNVVTILNGSEFFYVQMVPNGAGDYTINNIIYADLSTNPDRQIWLVQTKNDGMITEIKTVYEETATTIKALVADNTTKNKTRVATFNKADLVGGDIMQAVSIRDYQYNPVMIAIKTEMGKYYIFPNGYTIGVLSDGTSVFFISQIVIEKFRNTQEVSGSGYRIGQIEADEVVLRFDDEHAVITDEYDEGTDAAIKGNAIQIVTNTDVEIGTAAKPFRIDVTSNNMIRNSAAGGFSIGDAEGVFRGTAYIKDIDADFTLGNMAIASGAKLTVEAENDIVTANAAVVDLQKGGSLGLFSATGNVGTKLNLFRVKGYAGGNALKINQAANAYLESVGNGTVLDVLLPQTGFAGEILADGQGDITITLPDGTMRVLRVMSVNGTVALNAQNGSITAADADDTAVRVSGHNIILNTNGSIGHDDAGLTPLVIDTTPVNGVNGVLEVVADNTVNLNEVNGTLTIQKLDTAGNVILQAAKGSILTAEQTVINGQDLVITAGNVGSSKSALVTNMTGAIDIVSDGFLNLSQDSDILATRLQAAGNVIITTKGDILPSLTATESGKELLALQKAIEEAKAALHAAETKAATAQEYADSLDTIIDEIQTNINEAQQNKDDITDELNTANNIDRTDMTEKEIKELDERILTLSEDLAKANTKLTELNTLLTPFKADAVISAGKTKAQADADTLRTAADAKKNNYDNLLSQLAAKKDAVAAETALIQAGGNMSLNAGGLIGNEDKYLAISAGGRLDADGQQIYILSTGDTTVGTMKADTVNGTINLIATGDIKAAGVAGEIAAGNGNISSVSGNIGSADNQLKTSFDQMSLFGNNIYEKNDKDVTIGVIAALETADIVIIGNLSSSSSEAGITAKNANLHVNGDMGSTNAPIIIDAENAKLYAGNKLNAELIAKEVKVSVIEAGGEAVLRADGNLICESIKTPKITLSVDGSLGNAGSPVDIQSNDIIVSSKMNKVFINAEKYVPTVDPSPSIPSVPTVIVVNTANGSSMEALLADSMNSKKLAGKVLISNPMIPMSENISAASDEPNTNNGQTIGAWEEDQDIQNADLPENADSNDKDGKTNEENGADNAANENNEARSNALEVALITVTAAAAAGTMLLIAAKKGLLTAIFKAVK